MPCRAFLLVSLIGLTWVPTSLGAAEPPPDFARRFPWFAKEARPLQDPEILVDGAWTSERLERREVIPVDVRSPQLFASGHLPGAINLAVPPNVSEGARTRSALAEASLRGGETLVLYGGDDRLAIGSAFLALAAAGWESVKVLGIPYESWARTGLSVETMTHGKGPATPAVQPAGPAPPPFIAREELRASFGRPGFEILDLRDSEGWGEESPAPPRFAAGHIPHSQPFDVMTLLPATGWPDPAEARTKLSKSGPRPSEPVDLDALFILYGEGPAQPELGLAFLTLRLLGLSVRVFPEGFVAWASDAENPVVKILSAAELLTMLTSEQRGGATALTDRAPTSFVVFDLREDWDYDEGHIPGADSLPERLFSERFEAVIRARWPHADAGKIPIVFYCYGRECTRSRRCATIAAQKGFRNLLWFRDGTPAWEAMGGPEAITRPAGR